MDISMAEKGVKKRIYNKKCQLKIPILKSIPKTLKDSRNNVKSLAPGVQTNLKPVCF